VTAGQSRLRAQHASGIVAPSDQLWHHGWLGETATVVFVTRKGLDDLFSRFIGAGAGCHCALQHCRQFDVWSRQAAVGFNRADAARGRDALVFCGRAKGLAAQGCAPLQRGAHEGDRHVHDSDSRKELKPLKTKDLFFVLS
jgi:hypothetical protein